MTNARLTAMRLVGFKSFAERTLIEFGPGISAIVGPNGSGKSNLADALRWTLGEQGRQLRTRRAEDVIFAGSSSRKAIGMADVTLVIDNQDRLLPVDYGEVEIGRRLYRSGENEYLLNRQRIRLRDLVELLDAGNLADNAFLFIGQGMVDQALALRPEERRPLFEEAAGVRRHERRRRQAEVELAEAEANLERMRDLLGELRPQARRLSAQAEQLQARRTAGLELAEALLAAARARWMGSAAAEGVESAALDTARRAADRAMTDLTAAESAAATTSEQMANHADQERAGRHVLDRQRAEAVELRVAQARTQSELAGLAREIARIASERDSAEGRVRDAGRSASTPAPQPDAALAAELESIERSLEQLVGGAPGGGDGAATAASRVTQELAARRVDYQQHSRRAEDAATASEAARAQLGRLNERLIEAEAERDAALAQLADVGEREARAQAAFDNVRSQAASTSATATQSAEAVRQLETEASAARASLAGLDAALDATADEGLARAARARGGSLIAEGLEVEGQFRKAVSAALDHAATGFVVDDATPLITSKRRGTLVIRGGGANRRLTRGAAGAPVLGAAQSLGGGSLVDAIRRDPQGEVARLIERVVWLPDLSAAVRFVPSLLPGWRAVTLAGDVVTDDGVVRLASGQSLLELRAERDEVRRRAVDLENRLGAANAALKEQRARADGAAVHMRSAQATVDEIRAERRSAEEHERVAQRRAEQWLREVTWERSQAERLDTEAASATELVERLARDLGELEARSATPGKSTDDLAGEQSRIAELRTRRAELGRQTSAADARVVEWQEERRRTEVRRAIDETRLTDLDGEQSRASALQAELTAEDEDLGARLAAAQIQEQARAAELDKVLAAGAEDRSRLIAAERAATEARERLRVAEQQTRKSEVAHMEARLQLEQVREQLLVELAGIGQDGLLALQQETGSPSSPVNASVASDALEGTLDTVVRGWRASTVVATEPPTASRLGTLRRRFHDLGAGNPFAVEEYAELRERLDAMEAQRTDLESAIGSTRELIASLSAMITDQFRRTFAALEDAFARRFKELFGGGDAELSLTAPEDLSATGVEIHARPPGKKRQPLSMLSGGERALTAVSLLLAMLEVRPVPFCVLDEVDAALDEANVARFAKALRGLAEQTQFIVITHNRGTIEGADALYGVTIGDDAVSRVVSLRLPKPSGNGKVDGNGHAPASASEATSDAEESAEAALA
ncbi:MAG: chromosome segregation protein SMC [Candidatus Limnocylindrales bacterium]